MKNTSQPSSLQVKGVTLHSTAGNTVMTLTGNIRKYWTLRRTGKQEPSRRQSTQKKTSNISMEYPSNYQIFGNQYYEKAKQRKEPPKLQHHQTESTKVSPTSMVSHRSATKLNQSETTLKYFNPLRTHKCHTHTHIPLPPPYK